LTSFHYNIGMWIWPLFLSIAQASEVAIDKYCFSSPAQALKVSREIQSILLPVDRLNLNGPCFSVDTPAHRRQLMQSFVQKADPQVSLVLADLSFKPEPCHLKIEKIKQKSREQQELQLARNQPRWQSATQAQSASEISQIQTIRDFELQVDLSKVSGQCRRIGPDSYEIHLELRESVLIRPDRPISEEPRLNLQTQLQLTRGERIEIGSLVRKWQEQHKQLAIPAKVNIEQHQTATSEQVFLSIQ
jgi:hypothetical protein